MKSGLGSGNNNTTGNGDVDSQTAVLTVTPMIKSGYQNLNTQLILGSPRQQTTYTCTFNTDVSCDVVSGTVTVTSAINMDPASSKYGQDVAAAASTDNLKLNLARKILALGNARGTPLNSCSFQLTDPVNNSTPNYYITHNKRTDGFRCVKAKMQVRVKARSYVSSDTDDNYKTKVASDTESALLNVDISDNCFDEKALLPSPQTLPVTANYGAVVSASDRWIVVVSPNDNQTDSAGNVVKALVGSVSIFDLNNLNLAPQKLYLPGSVGGGSTGDSTYAASVDGNSLVVSLINRQTGKGAVFYYVNTGSSWAQRGATLYQHDGQDKQRFGHALALSSTGLLAVSAPYYAQNGVVSTGYGDLSGKVYYYNCNTSTGCSYLGQIQNATDPGSIFGAALSISGNRIAVGAPYLAGVTDDRGDGYASVYDINQSTGSASLVKTIRPPNANPGGYGSSFGASVSISGSKLVVGSPNRATQPSGVLTEKVGRAYYYADVSISPPAPVVIQGASAGELLGAGVALNADGVFVGAPYAQSNMGRVGFHPYAADGSISKDEDRFIFPLDRISRDGFGNSVFATRTDLIVGASNRTVNSNLSAGAAYRYVLP
jgi:hypothetical protein